MQKNNPNKTVSVSESGMIISFTDTNKHQFVYFDKKFKPVARNQKKTEEHEFNKKQKKMYAEALYGVSIYSNDELNKIPHKVILKIIARCYAVQKIINRWKQEIVNERVDSLLVTLFPKSPVVKAIVETKGYDDTIKNKSSFKSLGLTEHDIAKKLIEKKILPENFFNLV